MQLSLSRPSRRLAASAGTIAGALALAAPAMAGDTLTAAVFSGQAPVSECAAPAMTRMY